MKSLLWTFSNQKTFFQNNVTSLISFIMFFQVREGSVDGVEVLWLLLKEFKGLLQ